MPVLAYAVALFQIVLWFYAEPRFLFMKSWSPVERVGSLLVELSTTFLVFYLVQVVSVGHRFRGAVLRFAVAGVYVALLFFRWNAGSSLDLYLLAENLDILFYHESLAMLMSKVTLDNWLICLNAVLLLFLVDLFLGNGRRPISSQGGHVSVMVACALLFLIVVSPIYYHNDLSYVARTGAEYCLGRFVHPSTGDSPGYPYFQTSLPSGSSGRTGAIQDASPQWPHVFIIMMESFNSNFVQATTESGKEVTPVFNSLIREGVLVERFYGNSIQTCRGQLAVLCSILPGTKGKVFTEYPDLRVKSLAHILRSAGYRTLFFKAYRTLKFDNTGPFMRHVGFEETHAMDATFASEQDQAFTWGWGLQDDKFYQKVFGYLDKRLGTKSPNPCFVCLHTVSHHVPFCRMPSQLKYLYPDPENQRQNFANSMFLADKYLAEFFVQLRQRPQYVNSIVIVTGDHGFPAGEHGSYYNEQGFWEENFRTPLLILWPGHLEARAIRQGAYSQVDIAPTILELLGISTSNHFTGRSILSDDGNRPIHLVQPYNGNYLCVVRFPLKYVRGDRSGDEYLFDLERDPSESHNLIEGFRGSKALDRMEEGIRYIHGNQLLIERNRIWPASGTMDDIAVVGEGPRWAHENAAGDTAARSN